MDTHVHINMDTCIVLVVWIRNVPRCFMHLNTWPTVDGTIWGSLVKLCWRMYVTKGSLWDLKKKCLLLVCSVFASWFLLKSCLLHHELIPIDPYTKIHSLFLEVVFDRGAILVIYRTCRSNFFLKEFLFGLYWNRSIWEELIPNWMS